MPGTKPSGVGGRPTSQPTPLLWAQVATSAEPVMEPLGKAGWLVIHDSSFPSVMWVLF